MLEPCVGSSADDADLVSQTGQGARRDRRVVADPAAARLEGHLRRDQGYPHGQSLVRSTPVTYSGEHIGLRALAE